MECLQAIKTRRSTRRYRDIDVSDDMLFQVLDAGRLAPTGGNMQPWEFIVIRNRQQIDKIIETTFTGFDRKNSRSQTWLKSAPLLIAVCMDYKRTVARYGEMGKKIALLDTAAAVENMLLAAAALELGSCWVSGFAENELAEILAVPEHLEIIALLPLGYPVTIPASPHKFSLAELVHYEQYGNLEF